MAWTKSMYQLSRTKTKLFSLFSSGEGGDEEAFKQRHNASERKRQAVINNAITTLKSLVFLGPSGKRLAKGAVLKKAVDHIQLQNSHAARLRKENDYLKRENQNLFKHVHLLRAVLVSNNLSAPAYHSVPYAVLFSFSFSFFLTKYVLC